VAAFRLCFFCVCSVCSLIMASSPVFAKRTFQTPEICWFLLYKQCPPFTSAYWTTLRVELTHVVEFAEFIESHHRWRKRALAFAYIQEIANQSHRWTEKHGRRRRSRRRGRRSQKEDWNWRAWWTGEAKLTNAGSGEKLPLANIWSWEMSMQRPPDIVAIFNNLFGIYGASVVTRFRAQIE